MVDFARASRINRVLGYLPGCMGVPSTRTEPCGDVEHCLQCWFRKQMTLTSAQPPATPLPATELGQTAENYRRERDILGTAIVELAKEAGITTATVSMNGPEILLLARELMGVIRGRA